MNLNIIDYNKKDILELFGIEEQNNTITLELLSQSATSIIQDINNHKQPLQEKLKITNFIFECLEKICNIENIFLNDELKQILLNLLHQQPNSKVIQQNSNQIIEKQSDFNINSFPLRYKEGVINPLKRQTFFHILNINTAFRTNFNFTESTNFILSLPNHISNVLSMRFISSEIPNSIYQFSNHLGTNEFTLELFDFYNNIKINKTTVTIRILDGNYTGPQLQEYLNNNIFTQSPIDNKVVVEFNPINGKFRFFKNSDLSGNPPETFGFNLDFRIVSDETRNPKLNMGWLLGFRKAIYTYDDDYVDISNIDTFINEGYNPESLFNCNTIKYILLHVNDFNKNHTSVLETPFQEGLIRSSDILAKIPLFNNNLFSNVQSLSPAITNRRQYFGPVNIEKLEIRLYDEFGRTLNLNECDYSFSLELECLYDL
jgi:hypothetical protein